MQDKTPRNKQGEFHGIWELYWTDDILRYKGLYINNKAFGRHESYYVTGSLNYTINAINGEYYGYYKYKYEKSYYAR